MSTDFRLFILTFNEMALNYYEHPSFLRYQVSIAHQLFWLTL